MFNSRDSFTSMKPVQWHKSLCSEVPGAWFPAAVIILNFLVLLE